MESTYWQSSNTKKAYDLQGKAIELNFAGELLHIFQVQNGEVYLLKILDDGSSEPRALIKMGENKYQYKDQQTHKYFEVKGDKLEYIHQGEVWKEYKKQAGI